jgi:hypothetical protein
MNTYQFPPSLISIMPNDWIQAWYKLGRNWGEFSVVRPTWKGCMIIFLGHCELYGIRIRTLLDEDE